MSDEWGTRELASGPVHSTCFLITGLLQPPCINHFADRDPKSVVLMDQARSCRIWELHSIVWYSHWMILVWWRGEKRDQTLIQRDVTEPNQSRTKPCLTELRLQAEYFGSKLLVHRTSNLMCSRVSEQTSGCNELREWSKQWGAHKWVSIVSERASTREPGLGGTYIPIIGSS